MKKQVSKPILSPLKWQKLISAEISDIKMYFQKRS